MTRAPDEFMTVTPDGTLVTGLKRVHNDADITETLFALKVTCPLSCQ